MGTFSLLRKRLVSHGRESVETNTFRTSSEQELQDLPLKNHVPVNQSTWVKPLEFNLHAIS